MTDTKTQGAAVRNLGDAGRKVRFKNKVEGKRKDSRTLKLETLVSNSVQCLLVIQEPCSALLFNHLVALKDGRVEGPKKISWSEMVF